MWVGKVQLFTGLICKQSGMDLNHINGFYCFPEQHTTLIARTRGVMADWQLSQIFEISSLILKKVNKITITKKYGQR